MNDIGKYIGVRWKKGGRSIEDGVDCWGLVVNVYNDEYGISLPPLQHISTVDNKLTKTSEELIAEPTYKRFKRTTTPEVGDLILVNIAGNPLHIGIVIEDGLMLHAAERSGVVIEDYKSIKWKNRVEGFYKYNG